LNKRKEEWIYIQTPEGKQLIASPDYIKKLLNLEDVNSYLFTSMYRRIQQLEDIVEKLEAPIRREAILELLKDDGKFHTQQWITSRVPRARCYDVRALESEGKLTMKKSGNHVLYGRSESASRG
jgi:hypothetical protein